MPLSATLLIYLLTGASFGLLTLKSGIPIAPLAGALIGVGFLSMSGRLESAQWPKDTGTGLEILIGT